MLRRLLDGIQRFVRILNETVRTIAAIFAILSVLGFSAAVAGVVVNNVSLLVVGVVAIIVSGLVVVFFYSTAEFFFTHSEHGKPGIKVLWKKAYYKYHPDNQTMEFGKHYKIMALRDGIDHFIDRYRWTGHGLIDVHLGPALGQRLVEEKSEYWCLNRILFDVPMKKGENREILLHWDLFDESREAVPFLSQPADYPIDRMTLVVSLPKKPMQITFTHFSDYLALDSDDDRIVEKRDGVYDELNGEVVYDILKPHWGHKYKIGWIP